MSLGLLRDSQRNTPRQGEEVAQLVPSRGSLQRSPPMVPSPRGITLLHNEPSSRTEKRTLSGMLLAEIKKLTCRILGWLIPAEIEG